MLVVRVRVRTGKEVSVRRVQRRKTRSIHAHGATNLRLFSALAQKHTIVSAPLAPCPIVSLVPLVTRRAGWDANRPLEPGAAACAGSGVAPRGRAARAVDYHGHQRRPQERRRAAGTPVRGGTRTGTCPEVSGHRPVLPPPLPPWPVARTGHTRGRPPHTRRRRDPRSQNGACLQIRAASDCCRDLGLGGKTCRRGSWKT